MNTTSERPTIDRDAKLLQALRVREPAAPDQLVAVYGDRAYRLAFRITGNRQDAEDALQDAFWSVTSKIDTFRGHSALGTWVYRIVANAAYQKLRRRPKNGVEISLDEVLPVFDQDGRYVSLVTDWSTSVADVALQRELRDVLESALAELPPHYRAVIVLRDVEGMSTTDVADSLGIPVGTVKTRTHRARLQLRHRLSSFMASASAGDGKPRERSQRHPHRKADVLAIA